MRSGIVVNLGCFPHRDEISLEPLIERFRPAVLVEWHDDKLPEYAERRAELVASLRCPVAPWEDAKTTVLSTIRGLWKSRRALGAR